MPQKTVSCDLLERMEQIAVDVKKVFVYVKGVGTWAWVDRDEIDEPEAYHGSFDTRLEALKDAVDPYLPGGQDRMKAKAKAKSA
jgi:hypothetical protein